MSTVSVGIDEYGALVKEAAEGGVPIGTILPYAGSTAPEGTLVCNGAEISRTTYAELFSAIGTTWGEGDGASTFNVPDLRGYFLRGTGGENAAALGVEQGDAIRDINGSFYGQGSSSGTQIPLYGDGELFVFTRTGSGTSTQNSSIVVQTWKMDLIASNVVPTADENRPINKAVNYVIVYE